jgi:hypothetical protein
MFAHVVAPRLCTPRKYDDNGNSGVGALRMYTTVDGVPWSAKPACKITCGTADAAVV